MIYLFESPEAIYDHRIPLEFLDFLNLGSVASDKLKKLLDWVERCMKEYVAK